MKKIMYLRKNMNLIISVIFMSFLFLEISKGQEVGSITEAKGKVQIIKKNSFKGVDYRYFKGIVEVKDVVRTKRKSYAKIHFIDKSKVFLDENSRLIVENYIPSESKLYVSTGKVIYKVYKRVKGRFQVMTPTALIGVKGTEFLTIVKNGVTIVLVKKGVVEVFNPEFPRLKIKLTGGTGTIIKPKNPPKKTIKIKNLEKFFYERKLNKEEKEDQSAEKKEASTMEELDLTKEEGVKEEVISENVETELSEDQNELFSTVNEEINESLEELKRETASIILSGTPDSLQMNINIPPTKLPE